jgi:hypothetical protein
MLLFMSCHVMSMSRFLLSFVQLFQHDRCANYLCGCNTSVTHFRIPKMYVIYQRLWMGLSWWISVRNFSARPYKTDYEWTEAFETVWSYSHIVILHLDLGGIMFLQIVSTRLPDYRLSLPKTPQYEYILSPWKFRIVYVWLSLVNCKNKCWKERM